MKSGISLIRALIKRPMWLFLDEPTANLDIISSQKYWEILNSLSTLKIVLITHGEHNLKGDICNLKLVD